MFNTRKKEETYALLNKAKGNFRFDKTGLRRRLLMSIEEHQLNTAEKKLRELTHKTFMRKHRLATGFTLLLLVVVISGSTFVQANISKPGDKFHSFDQMGERLILKLPISEAQKAKLEANIVDERNRELDYIMNTATSNPTVKAEAVKESAANLSNAIERTTTLKENFESQGKQVQAETIQTVLTRLQNLAEEQEKKVQNLAEKEEDEELKKQLEDRLTEIKQARQKAGGNNKQD